VIDTVPTDMLESGDPPRLASLLHGRTGIVETTPVFVLDPIKRKEWRG